VFHEEETGPVRWLGLVLVWAGWCWFFVREKHCWLAGLGWLKPTSEQAVFRVLFDLFMLVLTVSLYFI